VDELPTQLSTTLPRPKLNHDLRIQGEAQNFRTEGAHRAELRSGAAAGEAANYTVTQNSVTDENGKRLTVERYFVACHVAGSNRARHVEMHRLTTREQVNLVAELTL